MGYGENFVNMFRRSGFIIILNFWELFLTLPQLDFLKLLTANFLVQTSKDDIILNDCELSPYGT